MAAAQRVTLIAMGAFVILILVGIVVAILVRGNSRDTDTIADDASKPLVNELGDIANELDALARVLTRCVY
jgi:hypothetical protein